ncbi:hypothetical protein LIER_15802 [Lithospermum erythrorhizon]|uniref:Secreted protein n=1 Tax=Lithospermum erythrorhizon TaxID=34254 RepID=A0AAV3Q9I9_LITER
MWVLCLLRFSICEKRVEAYCFVSGDSNMIEAHVELHKRKKSENSKNLSFIIGPTYDALCFLDNASVILHY